MNQETIERWAQELCKEHWGCEYTGHIKLTNRDWKYRNAAFSRIEYVNGKFKPPVQAILMSNKVNSRRGEEKVKSTILHELVHWRLYNQGIPHKDTDQEFIAECLRVGAPISKSTDAQDAYHRYLNSMSNNNAAIAQ